MPTSTRQPYRSLPTLLAQSRSAWTCLSMNFCRSRLTPPPLARAGHETRISLALPPPAFPQHLALLRRVGQG
jgi:hypothetical protein